MSDAYAELERIERWARPIFQGEEELTFEQLGHLTVFVSVTESTLEPMLHSVEQLARVRDAATPER